MVTHDRRKFQRLKLATPLIAHLDGENALVLDVGAAGAFVEHRGTAVSGQRFELAFRWNGKPLEFECEVARSIVVRERSGSNPAVSHTGLSFLRMKGRSEELLEEMMATQVGRLLAAQHANAIGQPNSEHDAVLARVGEARRARARSYMCYHFRHDGWSMVATNSPEQPEDGFTVSATEEPDELETLCTAYEAADDEGRRLIRLVAELSAMHVKR